MRTVFLRLVDVDDKGGTMLAAIRGPEAAHHPRRFELDTTSLAGVPGSPFAYWASDNLRRPFMEMPSFESAGRVARQGGINGDDFRWLRLWSEVPTDGQSQRYVPIAKGGRFSHFYADLPLVARWDSVRATFSGFVGLPHRPSLQPASSGFYFRPGLTWPRRTQRGLSVRVMPAGGIFADRGPTAFQSGDGATGLLAILALMNSVAFRSLVGLQMAFGSFEVGVIQRTPIPVLDDQDQAVLAQYARRAFSLKRLIDTQNELSHAFTLPALLQVAGTTLANRTAAWAERIVSVETDLVGIQDDVDRRCSDLYGIGEVDLKTMSVGSGGSPETAEIEVGPDSDGDDDIALVADAVSLAAALVGWMVGVAIGRFDVRLATGDRKFPDPPEPFDPLPACSPAILTRDDGLPLDRPPHGYPVSFPNDGILVDDPGHPRDLTTALLVVFDLVFSSRAGALAQEAAVLLDPREHDLRRWLASGFFAHHLRRHSESRRRAPVLWQLGTASGRYSVWCYSHRMTRDSLFAIENDVLAPKLAHEDRRLSSLLSQAGQSPSAKERTEIAVQESVVDELRILVDDVRRVAPLWHPDLDDGIVLTMAPLWRLVPTHKGWQLELRAKWGDLVRGKFDWAHVAMHLWPERVVPKCAIDRSLAIAHGLEDVFWVEVADGKWNRRASAAQPIEELIAERTSPAVKAALASLLEAPVQAGSPGKRDKNSGVNV